MRAAWPARPATHDEHGQREDAEREQPRRPSTASKDAVDAVAVGRRRASSSCGQHVGAQRPTTPGRGTRRRPGSPAGCWRGPARRARCSVVRPGGRLPEQLGVGRRWTRRSAASPFAADATAVVVPGALLGRLQAADEERVGGRRRRRPRGRCGRPGCRRAAWCRRRRSDSACACASPALQAEEPDGEGGQRPRRRPRPAARPGCGCGGRRGAPVRGGARRGAGAVAACAGAASGPGRWSASRGLLDVRRGSACVLDGDGSSVVRRVGLVGRRTRSSGRSSRELVDRRVAQRPAAARRAG